MPDSHPLSTIFLYLTDRCNLRCSHCWISPRFSEETDSGLPIAPLKKAIGEAGPLGLSSVKLTGGEPLLYRDLEELLRFLRAEGLGVSIETNGTLIEERTAELFKMTGISQAAVSLDAACERIHDDLRGAGGCFERTTAGIRLLSDAGLNVQVIMTLQRKNASEIEGLLKLCTESGVSSVKINHLLPFGRGAGAFRRKENLELDELIDLYRWTREHRDLFPGIDIFFDLPVAFRSTDEIKEKGVCECRIGSMMGILSNGDYSICGIGQTASELRIGNIRVDSIRDIWCGSPVLRELRESLPSKLTGICGNCIFKFQCLGCCRANAYAVSGNLFAPYFLCQSFFEAGSFPDSRCIEQKKPQAS